MAQWRSRHFTAVTALGPQEVELEHPKVVVSWLLSFHVLFRIPPEGADVHNPRGSQKNLMQENIGLIFGSLRMPDFLSLKSGLNENPITKALRPPSRKKQNLRVREELHTFELLRPL